MNLAENPRRSSFRDEDGWPSRPLEGETSAGRLVRLHSIPAVVTLWRSKSARQGEATLPRGDFVGRQKWNFGRLRAERTADSRIAARKRTADERSGISGWSFIEVRRKV